MSMLRVVASTAKRLEVFNIVCPALGNRDDVIYANIVRDSTYGTGQSGDSRLDRQRYRNCSAPHPNLVLPHLNWGKIIGPALVPLLAFGAGSAGVNFTPHLGQR